MNLAWKIVIFTVMINISGGIMTNYLHINNTNIIYNSQMTADSNVFNAGTDALNQTTTASIQSNSYNWASNFLDILGLGFITKILGFFSTYLFGFTDIIVKLLPNNGYGLKIWINTLISLTYTFAIVSLFAHKNLNED